MVAFVLSVYEVKEHEKSRQFIIYREKIKNINQLAQHVKKTFASD
jgi:hypothetical protein